MIHFTADHHFWHKNIIEYAHRPFNDVEEMNEIMIHRWNSVVKDDHLTYVLGDFAFASPSKIDHLLRRLNGQKVLVLGNHDYTFKKAKWVKMGFDRVTTGESIDIAGQRVELSHYPTYIASKWMLHGHVHNRWRVKENIYYTGGRLNVGVDVWNFIPVSLNKIIKVVRGKLKLNNDGCQPYEGDEHETTESKSPFYDDVSADFSSVDVGVVDQRSESV